MSAAKLEELNKRFLGLTLTGDPRPTIGQWRDLCVDALGALRKASESADKLRHEKSDLEDQLLFTVSAFEKEEAEADELRSKLNCLGV